VETLEKQLNHDVLDELIEFIHKNSLIRSPNMPTAILFTGTTTDNRITCNQIMNSLHEKSIFSAIMEAKACISMKSTMDSFVSQWFTAHPSNNKYTSKSYSTDALKCFLAYYHRFCPGKAIVLMLPDFEYFDPKVLQDLISLCR
jgi:hypothetical protein